MWLVSVSRRKGADLHPAQDFTRAERKQAKRVAEKVLKGAGDPRHERAFRMCITYCLHRALSPAEVSLLDPEKLVRRGWLAGGPIEVYYSRGLAAQQVSAEPCHNHGRQLIPGLPSRLYLPVDCGKCPPCVARKVIERRQLQAHNLSANKNSP